ncbi:hypothetical protein JG559_11420 [Enterococcus faecalis]|uniref:Uncharacterized protein n=1 Tax=Enterococcus faecalis TaxID=1351 RepID=A0A974NYP2_ENTFL|nr:hypothetical protein JG559_11420 [Enterococcus faecalis]
MSERDRTPEATLRVAERIIPGISEGLRQLSLEKNTICYVKSRRFLFKEDARSLLICPGSPKSVTEHLHFFVACFAPTLWI